MDDKTYIALLEKCLEERKDIISSLIVICEKLVKEREELSDELDRFYAENEDLRADNRQEEERFEDLLADYQIQDARICDLVKREKELSDKIKRQDGMITRRDTKIKELTVSINKLVDEKATLEAQAVAQKTRADMLYETVKEQQDTIVVYAATITEQDADLETLREEVLDNHEAIGALKADNIKLANENQELEFALKDTEARFEDLNNNPPILKCYTCLIDEVVAENQELRQEVKYLNSIIDGCN